MNDLVRPQIGNWYRRRDKGEPFQIIDVDEESGELEIQAFDGEIDSLDATQWRELAAEPAAQPADWTGALEEVESDDVTEDDSPSEHAIARTEDPEQPELPE